MQGQLATRVSQTAEEGLLAIVTDELAWAVQMAQVGKRTGVRTIIRSFEELSELAADVVIIDGRRLAQLRAVERAIAASDLAVVCVLPEPSREARLAWVRAGVRSVVDSATYVDEVAALATSIASRRARCHGAITFGGWTLHARERSLSNGVDAVTLTPAEDRIVRFLLAQNGAWVESARLSAYVMSRSCADSTLSVYISRLRKKLGGHIESSRGRGYRLVKGETRSSAPAAHDSALAFQLVAALGADDVAVPVDEAALRSILGLRRTLILAAAAAALQCMDRDERIRACDALLARLRDACATPAQFFELEMEIFRVLAERAGRPVLPSLIAQTRVFWARAAWYRALHAQTTLLAFAAYEDANRILRAENLQTCLRGLDARLCRLDREILRVHSRTLVIAGGMREPAPLCQRA